MLDTTTINAIKAKLTSAFNAKVKEKENAHAKGSDCDFIFETYKDEIIKALEQKLSLTAITKVLSDTVTYTKKNKNGQDVELKITVNKLARFLEANDIKRKVVKRKKKKDNK